MAWIGHCTFCGKQNLNKDACSEHQKAYDHAVMAEVKKIKPRTDAEFKKIERECLEKMREEIRGEESKKNEQRATHNLWAAGKQNYLQLCAREFEEKNPEPPNPDEIILR